MAATINLKILGKEHGMILHELNNTKQEIKNVLKQLLNIGQRKLGRYQNPGKSCLDILTRTTKPKGLSSGEYWIRIDSNGPLKVFCDMKTDGGGWTLITNVILQDSNGFSWSLATDYRKISEYKSNKLGASTQALGALKRNMPFTQLRFYCHKKTPGRTVDIVTEKNTLGQDVVSYFTGKSATIPKACGSFSPLPDDNSILARECGKWGRQYGKYFIGKWSHDGIGLDQRLYNHAFFIGWKAHWIVPFSQGGRWECDDYGLSRSAGDFWKIYVR